MVRQTHHERRSEGFEETLKMSGSSVDPGTGPGIIWDAFTAGLNAPVLGEFEIRENAVGI